MRARSTAGNGGQRTELLADPGPGEPSPGPVAAVVLLGERGAALEVEALEPTRALALLTPNLIHSGTRAAIGAAFAGLAGLLRVVPAFKASLPDDLSLCQPPRPTCSTRPPTEVRLSRQAADETGEMGARASPLTRHQALKRSTPAATR